MSILNAYYFPGRRYEALYDRISPVNSFRVVLNTFFAANLELLPDRSFFSTWAEPYHFIDVTDDVRSRTIDPDPSGPLRVVRILSRLSIRARWPQFDQWVKLGQKVG